MSKQRRQFSNEEKVRILRRHLIEKVPVSDLCDELKVAPTLFYRWQQQFFENGALAFGKQREPKDDVWQQKAAALEAKLQRKNEVLSELMEEHLLLKKRVWGGLTQGWVAPEVRDQVVDWVFLWSRKSGISQNRLLSWLGVRRGRFQDWQDRRGKANLHNSNLPRSSWLFEWEVKAILDYQASHPHEGYRRLRCMMLDKGVVAVSASTVRRVLSRAGVLPSKFIKRSLKGTGFQQPWEPHQHWHVDVSYINIHGTFFYLFSILDGASRYIVHWELREAMTTQDIEVIVQRAREKFPEARPRIISDNGPQFIANDFKSFIRMCGMTHVRTSPFYPQSNGKIERWHRSMKEECIRPGTPLTLEDARRLLDAYVHYYNHERLHSALDYIAPVDRLEGRHLEIFEVRREKLKAAALKRRQQNKTVDTGHREQLPSVT